jgi:hypothetical protein
VSVLTTNPPSSASASPVTASTAFNAPTTNPTANPPSNQSKPSTWQTLKKLLPSLGAAQTITGLLGLILAILGIKWAVQTYFTIWQNGQS